MLAAFSAMPCVFMKKFWIEKLKIVFRRSFERQLLLRSQSRLELKLEQAYLSLNFINFYFHFNLFAFK